MDRVDLALAACHIVHSILLPFPLWSYSSDSGTHRIPHCSFNTFLFPLWPYSSDSGTDRIPHCSFNTFPLPLVVL